MDNKYKVKVLMLKGEKGYKGDVGPQGPKGDKGDPLTFENLTEEQKQELMTNLSTYMKKEEGSLSVAKGKTMIQTNITTYNEWSMLFVFANGVALSKDEYEIQLTNDKYNIVLKTRPKEKMTIDYVCYNLIEFAKADYDKLKGPKGDKGDKGDTGPIGPAGSIENLVIGGRNLLTHTNDITADNGWDNSEMWTKDTEKYRGMNVYYSDEPWTGYRKGIKLNAGETVTFSIYAKTDNTNNGSSTFASTVESPSFAYNNVLMRYDLSTDWKRYSTTYQAEETGTHIFSFSKNIETTYRLYLCGMKLETNLTPTDWTPAQEDIDDKIDNKLSHCDWLLNTTSNAIGTINWTESKTYNFYTINIECDNHNGIIFTIPKYVMDNFYSPFYLDVTNLADTGYSVKTDGYVYDKAIEIKTLSLTGWNDVSIHVFGVY